MHIITTKKLCKAFRCFSTKKFLPKRRGYEAHKTKRQIIEMHSILKDNGINRFVDPMNLVLVSAKTHATLHTDEYIAHVYSYISQARGSRAELYAALFFLRLEIAARDVWALGY